MRVMVLVKATADSEAGALPSTELLEAMGSYNEELVKAGILLSGDGLKPSAAGKRVAFDGPGRLVIEGRRKARHQQAAVADGSLMQRRPADGTCRRFRRLRRNGERGDLDAGDSVIRRCRHGAACDRHLGLCRSHQAEHHEDAGGRCDERYEEGRAALARLQAAPCVFVVQKHLFVPRLSSDRLAAVDGDRRDPDIGATGTELRRAGTVIVARSWRRAKAGFRRFPAE